MLRLSTTYFSASLLLLAAMSAPAEAQRDYSRVQLREQLRQTSAKMQANQEKQGKPEKRAKADKGDKDEKAEKSASSNDKMQFAHDIAYGKDPLQKLDIYSPRGAETLPVVLFVHGGGWRIGDKESPAHQNKGSAFSANGVVLVSTNYRLSPAVKHPAHVEDVAAACDWVHDNIKKYGGDPDKIYLMGHSAGAHLVLLLATNDRFIQEHKMNLRQISGVISLDTASLDLLDRIESQAGNKEMYEQAFGHDPKTLTDASPTLNIHKGKDYPPFLMFCSAKRRGAIAQHEKFISTLKSAGGDVTFQTVPLSHAAINQVAGKPDSEIFKKSLSFVKQIKQ